MTHVAVSEERIFHHPTHRHIDLPPLDLLTILFDSEHCAAQEDTVLHIEASNPSNKLTKAALRDLFQQIGHGLRSQYGIGADGPNQHTVTVITYGQILVPALLFGIICAGGVYSAASPSSTVSELARQVKIAKSKVIVCGKEHVDVARRAAVECGLPLENVLLLDSTEGSWKLESVEGRVNAISREKLPWKRLTHPLELKRSLIVILWSSGTTGLPKGVMLSHTNLVAESYLVALPGREYVAREMEKGTYEPKEYTTLAHLPISHIAGLFGYLIGPIYSAGTVYWMRKYEWKELLNNLQKFKITMFYTVPSIWLRISKAEEVRTGGEHFKFLEGASTGAAPMDSKLQHAANARLGDGKSVFVGQTWGLSETTGAVTAPLKEAPDNTGSIGWILPSVELRIVDEQYKDVKPGEEGELLVRSSLVTNGYYENEEATKGTFVGGWFCTGDIGVLREDKFYVVDRKKELLKYKGLQVAPAELENVLFTHPQIREAAVVGIPAPDDPGTDLPRAYVVPVDRSKISEDEVKEYVKARLAPYKQLRGGVAFIEEIPKNAIGKFLRRELRERAKKEVRAAKL
ncbi:hypothetical protein M409DRAFT_30101 [Zasmidium cellare ATCC 36951]|uniref:AMP-dependent synthetase/ligase domain-containing protein n=1 Tax=Zasmidium cellare ATCC 36951 TaxID=1080233 RepID=A0A6A6C012_ZASCE|nr:uncharacterized protein M409DRAFT_30101 [Zasmidium cellare ATCC 36951]KAF2159480.1 hypothetical protein M409DRAFT_30101 [Zasmidium cellare ATCC 36951]